MTCRCGKPPKQGRKYCSNRCCQLAAHDAYVARKTGKTDVPARPREANLTGQRFGRLVAVAATPLRSSHGYVGWLCRCDCGGEIIRSVVALQNSRRTGGEPRCDNCVHRSPSALVAWAQDGVCSWCRRTETETTLNVPTECRGCERRANRNGRDKTGAPIYRGYEKSLQKARAVKAAKRVDAVTAFDRRRASPRKFTPIRGHMRDRLLKPARPVQSCRWCGESCGMACLVAS